MLKEYTRVMLVTDKYKSEGGHKGMIGYIIEIHPDGCYEVEFSDSSSGSTIAQLVVNESDIIAYEDKF